VSVCYHYYSHLWCHWHQTEQPTSSGCSHDLCLSILFSIGLGLHQLSESLAANAATSHCPEMCMSSAMCIPLPLHEVHGLVFESSWLAYHNPCHCKYRAMSPVLTGAVIPQDNVGCVLLAVRKTCWRRFVGRVPYIYTVSLNSIISFSVLITILLLTE